MNTHPNQKIILIKKIEANKDNPYSIISLKALDVAMGKLNGASFKLWVYCAKNQDQHVFALSCKAFMDQASCSKPTYLNAVKELIDKRYLVPAKNNSNSYIFYELPAEKTPYPLDESDLTIYNP